MFARARERGLTPFSSPFDPTAVELLESLDTPAYKIASAEVVDLPLIRLVASTGKPMIISSGMATLGEIDAALNAARDGGCRDMVLLACTASYPAAPEDARLLSIPTLEQAFGIPIGLSDHTRGIGVSVAAVALGAVALEKHVTLAREDVIDRRQRVRALTGGRAGGQIDHDRSIGALAVVRGRVGRRSGSRRGHARSSCGRRVRNRVGGGAVRNRSIPG